MPVLMTHLNQSSPIVNSPPVGASEAVSLDFGPQMSQLRVEVERVHFHNADNGWTVLKVRDLENQESFTVTGSLPAIQEGEYLQLVGKWTSHTTYGRQFKAERAIPTRPQSRGGILRYLTSGIIQGIGEKTAERIVAHFGLDTFKILDENPGCLLQVPKIAKKKVKTIIESWKEQKASADIMMFLVNNGISSAFSYRILKLYGDRAIEIISGNPYQLAVDFHGIGFLKADAIARRIGIAVDAPERVRAAIVYQLQQAEEKGHCFLTSEQLVSSLLDLLYVDATKSEGLAVRIAEQTKILTEVGSVICETKYIEDTEQVTLWRPDLYAAELDVVESISTLLSRPLTYERDRIDSWIDRFNAASQRPLSDTQSRAILSAAKNRVFILTGGPGVGKTTTANAIIRLFKAMGKTVQLAAPTGRAAQRLSEVSGEPAKTIHRLLEWQPAESRFARGEDNPLASDVVICDESSMLDIRLAQALVGAVAKHAQLIFIGDADQLPPVGPGNTLRDLIQSNVIPYVKLDEIFRQASASDIVRHAHAINRGETADFVTERPSDCQFIEADSGGEILEVITKLVTDILPNKLGFDPIRDVQILCPMNRGEVGTFELNLFLQKLLNPRAAGHSATLDGGDNKSVGRKFFAGDKVIQNVNNYELQVFNGDIGTIEDTQIEGGKCLVRFGDDRLVNYTSDQLLDMRLAYAITIHKSQGSEFPVIIIPMTMQHYVMLQRNLAYTALTRARKLAIFVGAKKALAHAIRSTQSLHRQTSLASRLQLTAKTAHIASTNLPKSGPEIPESRA
jgi:exodeoxyribonuclease V alpha subunit